MPNKGLPIDGIEITNSGACKLLTDCNPHKSASPDNIHSCFLKNTANEIPPMPVIPLFQMYRNETICVTQAYITPIHKAGSRTEAKNYHPVSLKSQISKTLEHIIHCMQPSDESSCTISKHQHGFRSRHLCETQLFTTIDDFAKTVNNRK